MPSLVLIIIGGIILTVGDVVLKFWVEKPRPILYLVGLLIYLIGTVCLVESYKSQNIAVASAVFIIMNIVSLAVVSWFYFGEKLTPMQIAGLGLSIVVILMLELGK